MRQSLIPLGLAVVLVVAATALFTNAAPPAGPAAPAAAAEDEPARVLHDTVVSFDGTPIRVTAFRPEGATAAAPVPVVLHSHGWSGSRAQTLSDYLVVAKLAEAGFGVVSIDARGHGESGGVATVHHRDFEVRDFQAVLDWVHDNLAWVQKEPGSGIPKDIVAGGAGYSYGGGFQLMTASYDKRLDALAPEITWSDLPYALAPEGVVKSVWVHFLVGTAKESGTRTDPRIEQWYLHAMARNEIPPDALAHFEGSSPVLDAIDAHVLLIQGVPDVLFNLNQATRAYAALEAKGTHDVRLFTHLSGHVIPWFQPFGTTPARAGLMEDAGPCGSNSDLVVRWMDQHLRGGPESGIAEVSFAMDDRTCLALDALPSGTREVRVGAAAAPVGAGSLLVPLAEGPLVVAGAPRLSANVSLAALEGHTFASLVVMGPKGTRIVDDQAHPILVAPGRALDLELAGVATRLAAGERLLLALEGTHPWYATNSDRLPRSVLLQDVVVSLPVVAS